MEQEKRENTGTLKISETVIITVAKLAIAEVAGVDSLSVKRNLFGRASAPIQVRLLDDVVELTVSIVAKHGCRATSVAETVQNTVKEQVQTMTGITVSRVNVIVAGIAFEKK